MALGSCASEELFCGLDSIWLSQRAAFWEAAASMGCKSWDVPTLSQGLPHFACHTSRLLY